MPLARFYDGWVTMAIVFCASHSIAGTQKIYLETESGGRPVLTSKALTGQVLYLKYQPNPAEGSTGGLGEFVF